MNEQQTADTQNVQTTEQTQITTPIAGTETQAVPGNETTQQNPADQGTQTAQVDPAKAVPASADAYSVNVEGFDFDAFKADNNEVLKSFHAAGMNNSQVQAVVEAYDQYTQVNLEALEQEWGAEYGNNVNMAKHAIEAMGFKPEDLDSPTALIRFAAAVGKNLQEDLPPQNTQQIGTETVEQLMMSEAYSNANHPDHKSVAARVSQYFQKNFPDN